jgi:hypothetical protein
LRVGTVLVAIFCSWFFLYVLVTGFFSQRCEPAGAGMTRCYVGAPAWGSLLQLLGVAAAGVSAWRITAWLTDAPSPEAPEFTRRATSGEVNTAIALGVILLLAGIAIPIIIAMVFFGHCPGDECHGMALVMIAYSYVLGSGGLLLSAGMYARRRDAAPRELVWVAWLWVFFSVLLIVWTAFSAIDFMARRPSTAIFWLLLTGIPGISGAIAFGGVRRLRPRFGHAITVNNGE